MNQDKISALIKDLRKNNHLTQQEFANKFGVTYQAVSKWENGKNIPDINILKQICEEYHLDINQFLNGTKKSTKKNIYIILLIILLISFALFFYYLATKNNNFEFKTLTTSCNNFNITGSIAYNAQKSSIYISHINYCGGNDTTKYKNIKCTLYQTYNNSEKIIQETTTEKETTLEEFLKNLSLYVNNYECKSIAEDSFHLEIDATDKNDTTTSYKIPLTFTSNCPNK